MGEGLDTGRFPGERVFRFRRSRMAQARQPLFEKIEHVPYDLVLMSKNYPNDRLTAGRRLVAVSPDSPFAKALLIELDWPNVKQYADAWEKDAAHQPAMLVALGKRHIEDGKFAAAERCLKAALALAPEQSTYYQLVASMRNRAWKTSGWRHWRNTCNDPKGPVRASTMPCAGDHRLALHRVQAMGEGRALRRGSREKRGGLGRVDGRGLPGRTAKLGRRGRTRCARRLPTIRTQNWLGTPSAGGPATATWMPRGKWPTNSSKTSTRPPPTGLPS